MDEQTFYFEDFCHDIAKYLKNHSRDYLMYSVDPFSPLIVIDEDQLSLTLSRFWHERENE